VRGMSSSMCGSSRALGSRQNSSSGGYLALDGYSRAASRLAAHPIPDISEDGTGATDGLFSDEHADGLGSGGGNGGDLSPVTPARPSGMCGGDLLGEPLMVRVGVRWGMQWRGLVLLHTCASPLSCSPPTYDGCTVCCAVW
jgi:hypothetical protein